MHNSKVKNLIGNLSDLFDRKPDIISRDIVVEGLGVSNKRTKDRNRSTRLGQSPRQRSRGNRSKGRQIGRPSNG